MSDPERPDVAAVFERLRPFQRVTADHVFRHLYLEPGGTNRFLVCDEVGLGKTLVARGVIAKTIEHLWPELPKIGRIDVVYICSNGQIARQNLNRLNVIGEGAAVHASRVTMLPEQLPDLKQQKVNFVSFTPGSSFDLRSSMGMWQERVLLYWLLRGAWGFGDGTGPKNVLQGGVTHASTDWFREKLVTYPKKDDLDQGLCKRFARALHRRCVEEDEAGVATLRDRFIDLSDRFRYMRRHDPEADRRDRQALIGELRSLLAATCIEALEPDLVILDEFQRFKHLLSEDEEAGQLARDLLTYSDEHTDVRVLLLSATPYKMYTLHAESSSDDHYRDFLHTLRFLMASEERTARAAQLLAELRQAVYRAADGDPRRLREVKAELERTLSSVMCRTERIASTPDGNGMLVPVKRALPPMTAEELGAYPALERLAEALDTHGGMLEYWKSSPYLLNFMQGYQVKRRLERSLEAGAQDVAVTRAVRQLSHALISWRDIEAYRELDPGNARLRGLIGDTVDRGLWQLLWLPPSMPYYRPRGAFAKDGDRDLTKRLVFSSWAVVPRTISAVISYATERMVFRAFEEEPENTPEARRRRRPLLQFAFSDGRLTGLPVLCLIYPSFSLARAGDALGVSWVHSSRQLPTLETVLATVRTRLEGPLGRLVQAHATDDGSEDERWYWAAPILLDLAERRDAARAWLLQRNLAELWSGSRWQDGEESEGDTRWADHVEAAKELAANPGRLGRAPSDLLDVLAEMAVAGPAVSALRSLSRVSGGLQLSRNVHTRNAAGQVGWAFRSLFNRQHGTALVRSLNRGSEMPYWRQTLRYCADGVLQGVLDEYAHVLFYQLGLIGHEPDDIARELAAEIAPAVSMRIALLAADEVRIDQGRVVAEPRRMRLHFAMVFGDQRDEIQRQGVRQEQVRAAFNSPFWPFILASTSVGQEGLDFHSYCHAVVHWNLPANPVDLEQREGRVHRYKCHAVRKNVAHVYASRLPGTSSGDPWEALFQMAEEDAPADHGGMVPYWVFDPEGGCRIERHVPALPLSRDLLQYEALRRSLAVYRMVFGQPRQEDLVEFIVKRIPEHERQEMAELMRIDLRPRGAWSDGAVESVLKPRDPPEP